MGKSRIASILVTRDRLSMDEAMSRINHCSERLHNEAVPTGNDGLAEEIIREELSLESDCLLDLL
jgi:hypothetical protein